LGIILFSIKHVAMYNNDNNNLMGREYHGQSNAKSMIIAALILMTLLLSPSIAYSRPFSNRSTLEETSTERNSAETLGSSGKTDRSEGRDNVTTTNQENLDSIDPVEVTKDGINSRQELDANIENRIMPQIGVASQEICASNRDNLNEQANDGCNPPPKQPICPPGTHLGGTKGLQCLPDNPLN
jgi:hypothetical protein